MAEERRTSGPHRPPSLSLPQVQSGLNSAPSSTEPDMNTHSSPDEPSNMSDLTTGNNSILPAPTSSSQDTVPEGIQPAVPLPSSQNTTLEVSRSTEPSLSSISARHAENDPPAPSSAPRGITLEEVQVAEPSLAAVSSTASIPPELLAVSKNLSRNRGASTPDSELLKNCLVCGRVSALPSTTCACQTDLEPASSAKRTLSASAKLPRPGSQPISAQTGLFVPTNGQGASLLAGVSPSLIQATEPTATDCPSSVEDQDPGPSSTITVNWMNPTHLAEPSSPTDVSTTPEYLTNPSTPGHSTNPSTALHSTARNSVRPTSTARTSATNSEMDNHKLECGCEANGEGGDGQLFVCSRHHPDLERDLQAALETMLPSAPDSAPSTDSDTDPIPHLNYLDTGETLVPPGARHPPVVSAEPGVYLDNRELQHISPPPAFEENAPSRQIGDQASVAVSFAPSLAPSAPLAPSTSPASGQRRRSLVSAHPSVNTQTSAPPNFNEAMQVGRPPRYMRIQQGDQYVSGENSANVFRSMRNSRLRRGDYISGDCEDCCRGCRYGCRFCGMMGDNTLDTCNTCCEVM